MTNGNGILLKPGTLAGALDARMRSALQSGVLQPIHTDQTVVEDGGVRFLVRVVSSLRRKEAEKRHGKSQGQEREKRANPFLPPEPDLTVGEVSRTHVAVLNKFNVLERHLLIVTRAFEDQESLLTIDDFRALFVSMAECDGLGFYNGGVAAGASQVHKHLQLVPACAGPGAPAFPMEPLLTGTGARCPGLHFRHAFGRLGAPIGNDPVRAASEALTLYLDLLSRLGIEAVSRDGNQYQSAPYNLLVAHDWMLAVPRVQECYLSVSINALGFAGSLFVKERKQLEVIRSAGPMRALEVVAGGFA
ncbi:MAG: hypothetical protein WCA32_20050 [Chromatiaceae bacterium]